MEKNKYRNKKQRTDNLFFMNIGIYCNKLKTCSEVNALFLSCSIYLLLFHGNFRLSYLLLYVSQVQ